MIRHPFHPFPVITTERLVLRQLRLSDAPVIFAHRQDEVVNTYLEKFRHQDLAETEAFITRVNREISEGRTILWALTEPGKDLFIGTVCLWNIVLAEHQAEAGYTLDSRYHGKAYMDEALKAAIAFGFETLQLKRIEAYTHEENQASIKLLLRNGFRQEPHPNPDQANRRVYLGLSAPAL